jgi:Ca2+/H+ antiporter, TMEM165/GDT1 family
LAFGPWRGSADQIDPIGETNGVTLSRRRSVNAVEHLDRPWRVFVQAFLISALLVALAEMGDRTQLLAIMLSSRYRRPVPILLGIFAATIANHVLAALAGFYLSSLLAANWFKYAVAISFIAMAFWALVPDSPSEDKEGHDRFGVFLTTAVAFFVVEIGDKTQIATMALAARFHDVFIVAAGTTTGMMLANIPAVYLGQAVTKVLPINALRIGAALVYLGLGLWGIATTAGWVT